MPEYPRVTAFLRRCSDGISDLIVTECPFCRRRHKHGAGRNDENPAHYLGFRAADCRGGRQYEIVGFVLVPTDSDNRRPSWRSRQR